MGFRTVGEMVGRADMLAVDEEVVAANPKLAKVDLSKLLTPAASLRPGAAQTCVQRQDHGLDTGLDPRLVQLCAAALPDAGSDAQPQAVYVETEVLNTHRCAPGAALCVEGGGRPRHVFV